MYSEYGALSAVDCQMLRMQKTTSMTSDWLRILPSYRSPLTGDWRSSVRELQKWRPAASIMELAQRQPLNLNVADDDSSPYGSPLRRRQQSNDDGHHGATDPATDQRSPCTKRRSTVANGRRFDFTRLAESATRSDDSPGSADDREITARHSVDEGLKVVKHDDDQSDRRLLLKPAAAAKHADNRSLICSTITPPLKSVFNPIESSDRYISATLFDDKIRPRRCAEPVSLRS